MKPSGFPLREQAHKGRRSPSLQQKDKVQILHKAHKAVRENATPIDNVTKFAWAEDDYEDVLMYIPNPAVSVADQIAGIQRQLEETDYRIIKCMEYSLAGLELPYDIQQLHDQRQELRDKINELEESEHGN